MATKSEPGKFDCYAKAADDEPIFTLRAKDPIAPYLVEAWRFLRAGELQNAIDCISLAIPKLKTYGRTLLPLNSDKSQEASVCAKAMADWLLDRRLKELENRLNGEST